jgi:hypothetical protein
MDWTPPAGNMTGTLYSTDLETGQVTERKTVACGHCGRHWVWVKGSGRIRGFCRRCQKTTCGPMCKFPAKCVPLEQMLENIERGALSDFPAVDLDFTRISVTTSGLVIPER